VEIGVLILMMMRRRTGGDHVLGGRHCAAAGFAPGFLARRKQVLDRFSSLQSLEVTNSNARFDAPRHMAHFPGSSLDRHRPRHGANCFPAYETNYDGKIVNHTHNDYLELLAETGVAGGICCAAFLGVLFWISLRQLLQRDKSSQQPYTSPAWWLVVAF